MTNKLPAAVQRELNDELLKEAAFRDVLERVLTPHGIEWRNLILPSWEVEK